MLMTLFAILHGTLDAFPQPEFDVEKSLAQRTDVGADAA